MRLLVLFLAAALCEAAVLEVGAGRPYASIGEALARAQSGDVIRVAPGVYSGNLVLRAPVTLEGHGRPLIRGDGQHSAITVLADGCIIRGFRIERSGAMLVDEDSGVLLKSSGNRIEDNRLRDVLYGVYLYQADRNVIAGNTIGGRPELELGERGAGIHIWNSSENRVENNIIHDTRDGLYLQNAYRSQIRRNRAFRLRYGLHYMFSDDNQVEDNVFSDSVAGGAVMYSKRIALRRNAFLRNRAFSALGVLFQDCERCDFENNTVADNGVGLFMEALRNSSLRRNLVAANDVAIQAFMSAEGNTFEGNNFVGNLSPIEVIGSRAANQWDGNYWSDYEGYDLDGDGFGDVPHSIQNAFVHLEDSRPRLRLYFTSPAAQALAFAERNFPVLPGPHEVDRRPLMRPADTASPAPDSPRGDWRWAVPPGLLAAATAMWAAAQRAAHA